MKIKGIIIGIILIIVGGILIFIGQSLLNNEWYSFPYSIEAMNWGNKYILIGVILFVVGVFVSLAEAILPDRARKKGEKEK